MEGIKTKMNGADFEVKRLGTKASIQVVLQMMRYLRMVAPYLDGIKDAAANDTPEKRIEIGFDIIEKLAPELDEQDLLKLFANLIGIDPEALAPVPLDETMEALAVAFEVNDFDRLIAAGGKLATAARGFVEKATARVGTAKAEADKTPTGKATPTAINRAARRRSASKR